jgi:hypothetical protein
MISVHRVYRGNLLAWVAMYGSFTFLIEVGVSSTLSGLYVYLLFYKHMMCDRSTTFSSRVTAANTPRKYIEKRVIYNKHLRSSRA